MQLLTAILGFGMFIFRFWLAEFKLAKELSFRRHYLSRIINLHLFLAIAFNFESPVFNAILIACSPSMLINSIWDYNFYKSFKNRSYWNKNHGWLIVERLTLHPPILIVGFWIYITGILGPEGFGRFLPQETGLFPLVMAIALSWIPFYILDKRWISGYNWPQPIIMIILLACATIVTICIWIFGVYYAN